MAKAVQAAVDEAVDRLMSVPRLSEYLDVPEATIYQWNHRRTGPPAIKVGKHLRYRRSDVDRWLDSQTVGGDAI